MAGSQKILLIEDDFMIRELYNTSFKGSGYEIEVVNDAAEAYKKLESFKPDVVFIDIMLPGISGMDVLKELRANPKYGCQKAKLILLTNMAQENLAKQAVQNKADGYIIKASTVPNDLISIVESFNKE